MSGVHGIMPHDTAYRTGATAPSPAPDDGEVR